MIEIRDLSHGFGKKQVLNNINLELESGSIIGLVGVNGAGKSTFLRILSGVYAPKKGSVLFDGMSPLDEETRKQLFFLPDDPYYTRRSTAHRLFDLYEVFYPRISRERFLKLLSSYEINPDQPLRNFSKGMRRQVFIALALAIRPKYLLMDEAFDGLDPLSRKIFKEEIVSFLEEENGTVLISSHSLRELEDFCDSFVLIDETSVKHHGCIDEHVGRLCKFEMAFTEAPAEDLFSDLPIVSLTVNGRFVKIVLSASAEEILPRLEELHPAVMEQRSVDFEEAFIYDVQKDGGVKK